MTHFDLRERLKHHRCDCCGRGNVVTENVLGYIWRKDMLIYAIPFCSICWEVLLKTEVYEKKWDRICEFFLGDLVDLDKFLEVRKILET